MSIFQQLSVLALKSVVKRTAEASGVSLVADVAGGWPWCSSSGSRITANALAGHFKSPMSGPGGRWKLPWLASRGGLAVKALSCRGK